MARHAKESSHYHYHGKTKVIVSWNRFARTLKEAFEFYTERKQAEFYEWVDRYILQVRRQLPIKDILVAATPFILFLLFYTNYEFLRSISGMNEITKPNFSVLPWFELLVFHCYPHQILARFAHPVLDFFAAIPYLVHFPLPAFFIFYKLTSSRRRETLCQFLWCVGWVNLIGVLIQFLFPTAPPWFVDTAVFSPEGHFIKSAENEAGFHRLDAILGFPFFHKLYAASKVKFGAFPSLHVAWPTVILVSDPWISEKFAMFHVVWISWAALYSNHHYGVDAIGGILLVFFIHFMSQAVWSPFRRQKDSSISRSPVWQNSRGLLDV